MYTKSISADFGGRVYTGQLHSEIKNSVNITKTLSEINTEGDALYICFTETLPANEETALNNLISLHSPIQKYSAIHTAYPKKEFYKDIDYRDISSYIYEGSKTMGAIKQILCVAYKDSGITNYSVRVYDNTHSKVITENTFTNSASAILELTPISNIPMERSILSVQVKKVGGASSTYVYVDHIQFRI